MFGVFDETVVQAQPAEGDFLDEVREGHCQPDGRAVKILSHCRFRGHDVDFPLICVEIRIFRNVNIIDDERIFIVAIDERRVHEKIMAAFGTADTVQCAFEQCFQRLGVIMPDDSGDLRGHVMPAVRADDGFRMGV